MRARCGRGRSGFGRGRLGVRRCALLGLALLVAACGPDATQRPPRASQGLLDLSAWDFAAQGPVELHGEWQIYWKVLLEPGDFARGTPPTPTGFIEVPSYWNGQQVGDQTLAGQGYATYRLVVRVPPSGELRALRLGGVYTAYRVFVDGRLLASTGVVGVTAGDTAPDWDNTPVSFQTEGDRLELLVQVSNFHHARGGFSEALTLDTSAQLQETREAALFREWMLGGGLLTMGLLHFAIFSLRRRDPTPLYFGAFCLSVAARTFTRGESQAVNAALGWATNHRIEYLALYLCASVGLLFFRSLFPQEVPRGFVRASLAVWAGLGLIALFAPVTVSAATLPTVQVVLVASCLVVVCMLALAAARRREGALLFLGGLLLLVAGIVNDVLVYNHVIETGYWFGTSFVTFVFVQAYVLSARSSRSFALSEELSEDLERKVALRTAELADINELARAVNSTLDLERVMATARGGLQKVFAFDQTGLLLADRERGLLHMTHLAGASLTAPMIERFQAIEIPLEEAGSAFVASVSRRDPVYLPSIRTDQVAQMSPSDRRTYEVNPVQGLLLVPLELLGEIVGGIMFANSRGPLELEPDELERIQRYVTPLATALQNARLFTEAEAARGAAETASRTKSSFLANMSHELRTPLNAIIGYGELLKEEAEDRSHEVYGPDLERILSSARHLLELINGVLDLAKIESGKMEVHLEDFDVAELVRAVAATVQPLVGKNGSRLEVDSPDGLGVMRSDTTKLRQMLFNLLSNASKFTREGVVRLEAERTTEGGSDWLRFRVRDSGIGMDEEQLARAFDEFSQANASTTRDYGGTGLGLPITKKFAEMLGGSIEATSQPGRGSTFELRLPAQAADD